MSAQTLAGPRAAAPCAECGELVLAVFTIDQRPVVLDAERERGGIYRLDSRGRAVRCTLVELHRAELRHRPRIGYSAHDCTPPPPFWVES